MKMKYVQLVLMFILGLLVHIAITRVMNEKREKEAVRNAIAFVGGYEDTDPGRLGLVFEVAPQLYDLAWLKICEANKLNKNYDYAPNP